jgi:hypothetical protein
MLSSARRLVSSRHLRLALAAAAVVCLAAPISANAATTRYASPGGTGAAHCVEASAPCSIEDALKLENTASGDTVLLAPGTYEPSGTLEVLRRLTVSGEAGKPPPVIEAGGEFGLLVWEPSTIRDIRIESPPGTGTGLLVIPRTGTVERVESVGEANKACSGFGVFRDTVCSATPLLGGGEGFETFLAGGTPETATAELFNVTAIGGFAGIGVAANQNTGVIVKATNTIVSGGTADVMANSLATTAPVTVTLSHSNFETFEEEGEAEITSSTEAGNQTAAPLFVNAAAGDYREQEGSPTRLAGDLGVVLPGEFDLAGSPRTTNCAGTVGVDIGAYQFECPAPPVVTTPGGSTITVTPPPPAPKPSLTKLALKPSKFVTTGKPAKGHAKGTTISFTLSTAASVKLEVLGKKTVKGKKPRTVTLGSLASTPGRSGANSVKFNGKVKGKPLEPGKYTLRATATGAGGSSVPVKTGFEVLIP